MVYPPADVSNQSRSLVNKEGSFIWGGWIVGVLSLQANFWVMCFIWYTTYSFLPSFYKKRSLKFELYSFRHSIDYSWTACKETFIVHCSHCDPYHFVLILTPITLPLRHFIVISFHKHCRHWGLFLRSIRFYLDFKNIYCKYTKNIWFLREHALTTSIRFPNLNNGSELNKKEVKEKQNVTGS